MVRAYSTSSITTEPRELDSRTSDGIEVRHGHQALDVYHHPYAYAARNLHRASEASRPVPCGRASDARASS